LSMRRMCSDCCAHDLSERVTVALASTPMNSRRRMRWPSLESTCSSLQQQANTASQQAHPRRGPVWVILPLGAYVSFRTNLSKDKGVRKVSAKNGPEHLQQDMRAEGS
jgi:hypothetical protein